MKNTIRIILLIVSFCIFAYSFFTIAEKVYGYYHDNKQYEQLRAQVVRNDSSDMPVSEASDKQDNIPQKSMGENSLPYTVIYESADNLDANGVLKEYSGLHDQNNDLAGWIRIPGFKKAIDYPVMQADDNDFYLKRDFYKNSSLAGSIYMDCYNKGQDDRNIVIYGHAMKDFSMFGNLKDFSKQPDKYTKIRKIYFDLMDSQMEYEIFSIYNEDASANYRQISFSSDNEYMDFLNKINSKSVYNFNVKLTPRDKIITLSTCSDTSNIRSVIHARLVKKIVYTGLINKPAEISKSGQQEDKNIVTANIYLKNLSLNYFLDNKSENAILTPVFNNNIKEYAVSLPFKADKITILFETEDPMAKAALLLNETEIAQVAARQVPTKPASAKPTPTPTPTPTPIPVPLASGSLSNVIKVRVFSQDSLYSRTYTINIVRLTENGQTEAGTATKSTSEKAISKPTEKATVTTTEKATEKTTESLTGAADISEPSQ